MPFLNTTVSGTESDSDSILTPDVGISSSHTPGGAAVSHTIPPPLSSIAEQSPGSGAEDSDEEEEEGGWQMGEDVAAKTPRGVDTTIKSGYLAKKGARRKVLFVLSFKLSEVSSTLFRHGRNVGSFFGLLTWRFTKRKRNTNF